MADEKPPRADAAERETILALLQYQRESFLRKVDGVDDPAAGTSPVACGTTLLWLEETARHAGHADILRELLDGTTGR